MDSITLALVVGLGSGVLGGMVSQLIAGAFKTRGDTRLLNAAAVNAKAAELRWQGEQAFEREKLLAEERRLLFIKLAHELQRTRERLKVRDEEVELCGWESWEEGISGHADRLFELETEIRIVAPALTETVRAATQTARDIRDAPADGKDEVRQLTSQYVQYIRDAMAQMRLILGTDLDSSVLKTSMANRPEAAS